ncbi:MAG: hypothetical protein EA363_10380 [Balneolaceae bacterium]|nr:MAG: hypothetical protein EA363_10380 [Balneolaceae bacterium]
MRALSFLLTFLAVAVLVVGSIFWINRDTFLAVFQNRPAILEGSEWVEKTYSLGGLIEFMAEQPQHAALLSVPFRDISETDITDAHPESYRPEHGLAPSGDQANRRTPDPANGQRHHQAHDRTPGQRHDQATGRTPDPATGQAIRYRSDLMHPAGTLSNLMLAITYADLVTSGALDPDTQINTEKVSSFHIPGLDRRHQQTFRRWKSELPAPPTIDNLVRYLLRHNDPAAADFLFFFLGPDDVSAMTRQLGGGLIEPPVPQFGLRMTALEKPAGQSLSERLSALGSIDRSVFLVDAVAAAQRQWDQPRDVPEASIPSFQDQRTLHGLYPRLQPDRFADIIASIWQNTLISQAASEKLQQLLLRDPGDRLLAPHVHWYAAQFDERMSYLSGWSAAGKTKTPGFRVQIILAVDIPAGLWFHMNSNFMIQDFHNRMFYDPAIRTRSHDLLM